MKFKEITLKWMDYKTSFVKESTFSAYRLMVLNHLLPAFEDFENVIEESVVQDFVLKKIKDGLSPKTVKDILVVLKMILDFGERRNLIEFPNYKIEWPSRNLATEPKLEVLSKQQIKELRSFLIENFSFQNLGILICLSTGMRIGEVCGLKWSNFDFTENIVHIDKTVQRIYTQKGIGYGTATKIIIDSPKTRNSIRDIPLSRELIRIIKPMMKIVNSEYYVLSNSIKPTEPRTYRNYQKILFEHLELPKMKFHALRHTFATLCITSGADIKTTSIILGHSNISTTLNIYSHPKLEDKKTVINKLFK